MRCPLCRNADLDAEGYCLMCAHTPWLRYQCASCSCWQPPGCTLHRTFGPLPITGVGTTRRMYPCPDCQPTPYLAKQLAKRAAQVA